MSAMPATTRFPVGLDGWTVDDLDLLPEDDPHQYELVDGALLVTPPPVTLHQVVAARLLRRLAAALGDGYEVITPGNVYFDRRNYRQPDVVVLPRAAARQQRLSPADVLLAVEVMSPSSVSTDRILKPAQYAAAGIPHFWRIEMEPPLLVAHELADGVYRETGRFRDDVEVSEPVPLRFRIADLLG